MSRLNIVQGRSDLISSQVVQRGLLPLFEPGIFDRAHRIRTKRHNVGYVPPANQMAGADTWSAASG